MRLEKPRLSPPLNQELQTAALPILHQAGQADSPGEISIAPRVFFSIVQHAALSTYGVVGIASRYTGMDNTHKEPSRGIEVRVLGEDQAKDTPTKRIGVDIHIIVEYGVRIPAVVSSLQHQIEYGIEHSTGYKLDYIHIHVASVRVSSHAA